MKRWFDVCGDIFSSPAFFWGVVSLLVVFRCFLTSDLAVDVLYAPDDDGLYVSRAFHFLTGEALGDYDARLLVKLPGFSIWLAAVRMLGIPYLLANLVLYVASGIYFLLALRRQGLGSLSLLFVFGFYLFNPIGLDQDWFRVMREPLSTGLLVVMVAAGLWILAHSRKDKLPIAHIIIFSLAFSVALLVREEDVLLYSFLVLLWCGAVGCAGSLKKLAGRWSKSGVLLLVAAPLLFAFVGQTWMRHYVMVHYGTTVTHELGEGNFPRLIAAMRSVKSERDNRYVMITQEALDKIRAAVPMMAPVIDRLPPPGPTSYSCQRFGVCSEWTNGWEFFWIKDAIYQAGLTPDAVSAQKFYAEAARAVRRACSEGKLECTCKGEGLFPPFELKWTRALIGEGLGIVRMMVHPLFLLAHSPPQHKAGIDVVRMFQLVTMTHAVDTLSMLQRGESFPLGQRFVYSAALAKVRGMVVACFHILDVPFFFLVVLALIVRIRMRKEIPLTPLFWLMCAFLFFTSVRIAALSYISVYMGFLDNRIFFSSYVVILLLGSAFGLETLQLSGSRKWKWGRAGKLEANDDCL